MLKICTRKLRDSVLRAFNVRQIRHALKKYDLAAKLPVFVIASPPDMHLSPFSVRDPPKEIFPVILANGLSAQDISWIQSRVQGTPVVNLAASLTGNRETYLSHAEVIHAIAGAYKSDFCIQDADCLVLNNSLWSEIIAAQDNLYGVGPFIKNSTWAERQIPDTFLVKIDAASFRSVCQAARIDASISKVPGERISRLMAESEWGDGVFPEPYKDYFDTLQRYWVAAELMGLQFKLVPGASEKVFHIGGSSYITSFEQPDLTHWDFWPANTIYFHLRFAELLNDAVVKNRLSALFKQYGGSSGVTQLFPAYKECWRYRESEFILKSIFGCAP
jgi:hypothetical protein